MTTLREAARVALEALELTSEKRDPLDDAMKLPNAMAKAYENGYNAGVAHERERIIRLLEEMQREVRDAHNYYGFAARRIREST